MFWHSPYAEAAQPQPFALAGSDLPQSWHFDSDARRRKRHHSLLAAQKPAKLEQSSSQRATSAKQMAPETYNF
jgi:hypothetical protein